jgi:hypothetical protein
LAGAVVDGLNAQRRPAQRALAAVIIAATFCGTLLLTAPARAQAPPGWITDKKTGCKVWNPSPQSNEAIEWSGPCKNGLADGEGTLQWTQNGKPSDRYVGEYHAGKRNGHGTVTFRNGRTIQGEWRDDELLQLPRNSI